MRSALRTAVLAVAASLPVVLSPAASAQGDDCFGPIPTLTGAGAFPFTTVGATNGGSAAPCNGSTQSRDVWWKWVAPYAGEFRFAVCDADYDVVISLRAACNGPSLRCSDRNGCGTQSVRTAEVTFVATAGMPLYIQLDGWNGVTGSGILTIEAPVGGTTPCTTSVNSTGLAGTLRAIGSTSLTLNEVTLIAENVPNQAGIFFHGTDEANTPFGNGGTLCVSNIIARSPVTVASGNVAQRQISLPLAGIVAPNSHYFQFWFRDTAQGPDFYNTTDSIKIVFVP